MRTTHQLAPRGVIFRSTVDRHQRRAWLQDYQTRVLSKQERKLNKVALGYFRALALETAKLFKAQVKGKAPGDRAFLPSLGISETLGTRAGLSDLIAGEVAVFGGGEFGQCVWQRAKCAIGKCGAATDGRG